MMCVRCGWVRAVHGDLCCHCHTLTTMVRELLQHGLTVRDVARRLGLHEKVVAPIAGGEHAQ